ncbi:MAG: M28 family peptidase [bacterium]|nr:M28 family peptidase [bacterium]
MNTHIPAIVIGLLVIVTSALADPLPLAPNSAILALVEQVDPSNLHRFDSTLVAFHTRHTYSDTLSSSTGIGAARQWVRSQYQQMGVNAELFPWSGNWGGGAWPCNNVHASLPGSGGPDRMIVLGGHLDSRTISPNNITDFAPGADDDGSSISAMLEMSRIFSGQALQTTIIPASFTGEEQGLYGSEAYAQYLQNSGADVSAMINMDMIGHIVFPNGQVDSTTVRCYSGAPQGSSSRQLARFVKWVGEAYSGGLTVTLYNAIDRPGRGGDHISFYDHGYPSCRLIETAEDEAYQHNVTDVPENMSFSYVRKVTRLAMGVTAVLANSPLPPNAPEVINFGDGHTLRVSWPDSLAAPPGGTLYVAYRTSDQLYWENVISTNQPPPLQITGLTENQQYEISIAITDEQGRPSLFSSETSAITQVAPPPEGFETTSTPTGILLNWQPRPEPTTLNYSLERALPGSNFAVVVVVPYPDSSWTDNTVNPGQLYLYRIRTQNNQMIYGEPTLVEEGQLATHQRGILMVDATPDGSGFPGMPTDNEVDDFYSEILTPYSVAAQWDRSDSTGSGVTISDADLAPYALTLIYADYFTTSITADTTAYRKYLANGGKLLVCGWRLSYSLAGAQGYDHGFNPGDFIYDLAGIDSIRTTPPGSFEMIGAHGTNGYPDLTYDTVRFSAWSGLLLSDAIWTESFPPDVQVIGTFSAASGAGSPYDGRPVALKGGGIPADWIILDVPPFYMTPQTAEAFLRAALDDLDAPTGVEASAAGGFPNQFRIGSVYPNPFNPTTIIRFTLPNAVQVRLEVFDIGGRLVRAQHAAPLQAGEHNITFDGSGMAAGVYVVRLQTGEYTGIEKMVLLK